MKQPLWRLGYAGAREMWLRLSAGETLTAIGNDYGVTPQAVRWHVRRHGYGTTRAPRCYLHLTHGYLVASYRGQVEFVHRLAASLALGRRLLPGEVVHHKDGNKRNNAASNLEVLPSIAAHRREHGPQAPCIRCGAPPFTTRQGRTFCRACANHERRYHLAEGCSASRRCRFVPPRR